MVEPRKFFQAAQLVKGSLVAIDVNEIETYWEAAEGTVVVTLKSGRSHHIMDSFEVFTKRLTGQDMGPPEKSFKEKLAEYMKADFDLSK
jgi:hypothetical protein